MTPQRIVTVDNLKDAALRSDMPFGVSIMNNHIYGSKVPQKPKFGAWIGISNQMRKIQIAIFRSVYQIDMKFDRQLRPATETSWVVSYGGKTLPRWRTAAILKIDISPYLREKSSDVDEILYTQQQKKLHLAKKLHFRKFFFDWTSRFYKEQLRGFVFSLILLKRYYVLKWYADYCYHARVL